MKSTFCRFTFLIFSLCFFVNNFIAAKTIDKVSLNQEVKPKGILQDTTKQKSQSTFFLKNDTRKYSLQKNSNTKNKFELGLEFGIFSTDIEYDFFYKTFTKDFQVDGYILHYSMMNGFSFAHPLNKKWWLQTGIRYGRSTWSDDIYIYAYYNKLEEQVSTNGNVYYDLILISSGKITESETKINVSITNASSLNNDDLIVSSLSVEKKLDWVQIPLGVAYRLGKKRLNYEIKGGLSLNQITVSNYNIEGFIEGAVSIFNINEITYPQKDNKRFLGTYLGAGVRYNLKENIILSTNFNLRYEPSIKVFENDIFMSLHFGASYLF